MYLSAMNRMHTADELKGSSYRLVRAHAFRAIYDKRGVRCVVEELGNDAITQLLYFGSSNGCFKGIG